MKWNLKPGLAVAALAALLVTQACSRRQAMYNQPKYEAYESSDFFANGQADRLPPEGTVARQKQFGNTHLNQALVGGKAATTFPFPVTREVLERGMNRYNIYCTPCHSKTGDGWGMVVQRGFFQPPSFHIPRLQKAPLAHVFNVITYGIGNMSDYSVQLTPEDRWSVVAYVKALQLSQNARVSDVPVSERAKLEGAE